MYQFKLPDLGEGIAEAEVVEWHVREGDVVQADQLIAEIMTDKAVMEIPSPRAGRVHRLFGNTGDVIPVGDVLIEIDEGDAGMPDEPAAEQAQSEHEDVEEAETDEAQTDGGESEIAEWRGDVEEGTPATQATAEAQVSSEVLRSEKSESQALIGAKSSQSGVEKSETPISQRKPTSSIPPMQQRPGDSEHPPRMPPRPQAHPITESSEPRSSVDAVPAVREVAKQLGVNIEQIPGTGPGGRVMRRDVEAYHEKIEKGEPASRLSGIPVESQSQDWDNPDKSGIRRLGEISQNGTPQTPPVSRDAPGQPDEADWTRQPLRGVRRRIAERMMQSKTIIPHYTYVEEIDMTAIEAVRRMLAEAAGGEKKISPLAFIAYATLFVLPDYPQMNACIDEGAGEIIYKGKIHLGIAVATEEGLMVPVIRDAAGRSVTELATIIRDFSPRARQKKLSPSELKGSTFTMTSLGKLGGVMATPIINYPASAIMGVHAIRTLPRYMGDQVEPRKIMNLSVSLDHRIVDGFEGAQFLQDIKEILEWPDFPEFK